MAKFCTKCGKEIEEGKTCSCEKEVKRETSKTEIDIKESFIDCLNIIKKIFVKPFETVEKFAVEFDLTKKEATKQVDFIFETIIKEIKQLLKK